MRQQVRDQARKSMEDRGLLGPRSSDSPRRYDQLLRRFDAAFETRWPRYHVLDLYRRLLAETPSLRGAGVTPDPEAQEATFELGLADLAALAYLRMLVDGLIPLRVPGSADTWTRLDHLVIDEAQDLSPLALAVLHHHANQLTVLGDVNQAIYAHRGSRSWKEMLDSLGNEVRQIHTLSPTYRSTQPLAELANHIVRVGGLDGGVCRSFPRQGPEPQLLQTTSHEHMREAIIAYVNEVCAGETSTAAILTRTAADARSLYDVISHRLPESTVCITDRRETSDGRVYVMPAYLAKGVEFDAVIVVDVDDITYSKTVNDATLLYVAVTRALHRLLVVWSGSPSQLIAERV
jgi:DNA helicase-2/ATP-dependent DNA helicase PcrA